jgi:hypothetical protein
LLAIANKISCGRTYIVDPYVDFRRASPHSVSVDTEDSFSNLMPSNREGIKCVNVQTQQGFEDTQRSKKKKGYDRSPRLHRVQLKWADD